MSVRLQAPKLTDTGHTHLEQRKLRPAVFVFRVDSATIIGTGHVMRCLTLANALQDRGAVCHFICRNHPGNIAAKITQEGHQLTLLPAIQGMPALSPGGAVRYASWLGANIIDDAIDTIECIRSLSPSWLIVDHYAIDDQWERLVKKACDVKIMAIDGQANRKHHCDLLLDQTQPPQGINRWKDLVPKECKLFVGLCHALLRPEFKEERHVLRRISGEIRRIFIGFGGVDEPNATAIALDAVASLKREDIVVDVVVGSANRHATELQEQCCKFNNVNLHIDASNVAKLMSAADLAIGGGGGMMAERCYLGLPAITIAIAENQLEFCQAMDRLGINIHLGHFSNVNIDQIRLAINTLLTDNFLLEKMQRAAKILMEQTEASLVESLFWEEK